MVNRRKTLVYLDVEQYEKLREEAFKCHRSMSDIVRELVDERIAGEKGRRRPDKRKALRFVGRASCGRKDVSLDHDDYLAGVKK